MIRAGYEGRFSDKNVRRRDDPRSETETGGEEEGEGGEEDEG